MKQSSSIERSHRQSNIRGQTVNAPSKSDHTGMEQVDKSNSAAIEKLAIDARYLRHTYTNGSCSTSIYRQYRAGDEPRMIAGEEHHRRRAIPSITFGAEQASRFPCRSCLFCHASSIHHGSVQHL
jgi:hypothetical protein